MGRNRIKGGRQREKEREGEIEVGGGIEGYAQCECAAMAVTRDMVSSNCVCMQLQAL